MCEEQYFEKSYKDPVLRFRNLQFRLQRTEKVVSELLLEANFLSLRSNPGQTSVAIVRRMRYARSICLGGRFK